MFVQEKVKDYSKTNLLMYVPYSLDIRNRGSTVRPFCMSQAFGNIGTQLTLISGSREDRRKAIGTLLTQKRLFDCAYVEPGNWPLHPFDYLVLLWLRIKRTPIGLYYRDAYWRFPDWFRPSGWQRFRHRIDLMVYRLTVRLVYFQSATMADLFNFRNKSILPPGARKRRTENERDYEGVERTALYVGGLTVKYGRQILFKAIELVGRQDPKIRFVIIGRRDEIRDLPQVRHGNVMILNLHGRQIEPFLESAHIALLPREKCPYNDLVLPVKLFDYLSYRLPIVATDDCEISKFIRTYRIGLVVDHDPGKVADAILKLANSRILAKTLSRNCSLALEDNNLWEDRARTVVESLLASRRRVKY